MIAVATPQELTAYAGGVFVPTMGALHAGHAALIRHAAELAGGARPVVVSIFINPTQFNDPRDFQHYPRTLEADLAVCESAGAKVVFTPAVETMYPGGTSGGDPSAPLPAPATTPGLEDFHRPGHFAGVCRVCRRLFELVRPAQAIFGEKDWQQLAVIRAMVADEKLGLEIIGYPTIREPDGLAMSSRNALLTLPQRIHAVGISRALVEAGKHADPVEAEAMGRRVLLANRLRPEYVAVRDAASLGPVREGSPARVLIAARCGEVRLIDNAPWPSFTLQPSPVLQPLVISAPFGNYVRAAGCTSTLGTFTALRRPGRLVQIIRTVRYSPSLGAWVNKLGLRNPGIDWLGERTRTAKVSVADKLVSIHGLSDDEWRTLLEKTLALRPLGIELNMSCPNIGHVNWPGWLFTEAARMTGGSPKATRSDSPVLLVVKLPPVNYREMFRQALGAGIRAFHCCNTIPVPAGGVSGKPLKPVAIQCIADVLAIARAERPEAKLTIIGGGGITTPADIDDYAAAGATHFAIGTKCFNPGMLFGTGPLRPLIERARNIHRGDAESAEKKES